MNNPYLLLTPGPLTTSKAVRESMMKDWCTWDDDYNHDIVQQIRRQLVRLATPQAGYTSVLMQGSGTASVEAVIGSALSDEHCLLILANGTYGQRIAQIANILHIQHRLVDVGECNAISPEHLTNALNDYPESTHVAFVHCETTTGILNPLEELAAISKQAGKTLIVDAMSSFGGIPLDVAALDIDFLISSANKCIQGVPGFGFIIAKQSQIEACKGRARSLSLDLYDQWQAMEYGGGKWRFTSPTHTVRAFATALEELASEGGVAQRHQRYQQNQQRLVAGMAELGFQALINREQQSPIITAFLSPTHADYDFKLFYQALKKQGFVIYPGKVSDTDCFRIGNIGEVYADDIEQLLAAMKSALYWEENHVA
ncbi:2-aminoethylphosphonate--pyruvate transaminase [Sinobacterium caligoides]|uniref:2-aminoethylphosphonate--pyruvate transaminase n=1 Tax=Sinobacterium caligoides TaxID=933926 RepID=A0A3N2E070_9GAMM|nr:2-aminoethylphosphonate--pyruvate transaminase [Sinobacterium caligoides]ROS05427.1 2-aminoethylphosphonate--pyruvate transaminase [Sinobacterium caligoides]